MAQRRMFSLKVIDTDLFLDMPISARLLYYDLSMRADDDGFVASPKKIQRMIGCSDDDFKILIVKQFIIPFENGVCVIKHWRIHNFIRNDRYTKTIYNEEKSQLVEKDGKYEIGCAPNVIPNVIPNGNQVDTMCHPQVRLGKDRLGKDNIYMSDSIEHKLADYLFRFIKRNNPNAKDPNIQSWCKDFDLILRVDKKSVDEVKEIIKTSQEDGFWFKNILSPKALRKHYDKLILIKNNPKKTKNIGVFNGYEGQRDYDMDKFEHAMLNKDAFEGKSTEQIQDMLREMRKG